MIPPVHSSRRWSLSSRPHAPRPQCAVNWDRNLKPKLAIMRQCTSVTNIRTVRQTDGHWHRSISARCIYYVLLRNESAWLSLPWLQRPHWPQELLGDIGSYVTQPKSWGTIPAVLPGFPPLPLSYTPCLSPFSLSNFSKSVYGGVWARVITWRSEWLIVVLLTRTFLPEDKN